MKKIVPFNNVLTFNTDVREITAISLEHDIKEEENAINGVFYISGEYKITDGQLEKDKFNFELPFDIALGCDYNLDTLVVDIDDFRYELVDRNKIKVNIDLYIDGEVIEPVSEEKTSDEEENLFTREELRELEEDEIPKETTETIISSEEEPKKESSESLPEEPKEVPINERLDLLDEMLKDKEEDHMKEASEINIENNNDNDNDNINIFNGFNEEEQYVTYHVYPVTENDTLDKILEKYNVTKEDLAKYNNIDDIHTGDKLIIPANNNDK